MQQKCLNNRTFLITYYSDMHEQFGDREVHLSY